MSGSPSVVAPPARARGLSARAAALLLPLWLAACGPKTAPEAGASRGAVPDLRGVRVMLFPAQSTAGVGRGADAELAFALTQRGGDVNWVLPAEMRQAMQRSPGMDTRLEGLPVGIFQRAEVRRVGDPLYGYLRRMGALTNSAVALVPVAVYHRPATEERPGAVEITATVLSVETGYVLWFGVVEGDGGGPPGDPRALASAADALGRALLPFGATGGGEGAARGEDDSVPSAVAPAGIETRQERASDAREGSESPVVGPAAGVVRRGL